MPVYDDQNIFAKILRGEIPNDTVYEDEYVLAFRDITPQAAVHVLVIPRGAYVDIADFGARASAEEIAGFYGALSQVAAQECLLEGGFRVIANTGDHGGQEVPHFHVHVLGGQVMGAMVGG